VEFGQPSGQIPAYIRLLIHVVSLAFGTTLLADSWSNVMQYTNVARIR
jgi:hypothetical protein